MPTVSLLVEALRARPAAVFWFAVLAQAAIWVLVPAIFYASPPGDLPEALAIGHEWQLGSRSGPPLAFWLAELAFNATGGRIVSVYILAQACVVLAFWAMFTLGRALAGIHQAALASLLAVGVFAFSAPTPEFGPAVLAMPLTALALLSLWRALAEGRRAAWVAFGFILGLLLLTTWWGLLFAILVGVFLLITGEGRAALATFDPWAAFALAFVVPFPHGVWLWQSGALSSIPPLAIERAAFFPVLLVGIIGVHAGLILLALLASGWHSDRKEPVPEIEGPPRRLLAARFVLFFALALPLAATLIASLTDTGGTLLWAAPFVLMSALAVIVWAGARIALYRQSVLGIAWAVLLLLPPAGVIAAQFAGPWSGAYEPDTGEPAAAMGRFFSETFARRTGRPLEIVIGDNRATYLVALAAESRPRVRSAATPARTPWLTDADIRAKGAIVFWDIADPTARPPEAIRARFPDLVAEVPQPFPRMVQGFLPAYRVGWGLIRPQSTTSPRSPDALQHAVLLRRPGVPVDFNR